ncbi:hypothetical protein FG386_000768 [Cryptosporidium ryanae]|uniref:uncharacterized protein n=1 Tax=Cryptosporidium ryanae TaxID=515981 RepID=UPI00351A315D|nr:hypothetical protein FG386_000768 [Cryptosporidium ryanae]
MKFINKFLFFKILLTFVFCHALDRNDTFLENNQKNNFLEKIELIVKKYEDNFKAYNKEVVINKYNNLKTKAKDDIKTGINMTINLLLDDSIYEFENKIDTIVELKTNDSNDILSNQINSLLTEFIYSKFSQNNERILQLNQSISSNKTNNILPQRYNNSELLVQNRNIPNYYPRPYYNNGFIIGNVPMNTQPSLTEKGLSGMLSISNPAFRMIISTVLMCLGSTPYGAISILIVITVYSLIEIVIKYFNNKFKKKNVINSIKKSSFINNKQDEKLNTNSTVKLDKNITIPIHNSLRNLKTKITTSDNTVNLLFNSIKKINNENIFIEKKINYFVGNLSNVISFEYLSNLNVDSNKVNLFNKLLNITIDILENKNGNEEIFDSKHLNESHLEIIDFDADFKDVDLLNVNLPEWYKKFCLLSIVSRSEYRLLKEYNMDEIWIPLKYNEINVSNEKFLEFNDTIIDNKDFVFDKDYEMNVVEEKLLREGNNSFDLKSTEGLLNEMESSMNNSDRNYLLYRNSNLEIKWYDRMITYSIQTYKQNGIRGVIIMILDIFSTIFSATPIGYLITTLIRLIAFMTDKLIQLSRRRKNQRLLSRMILELPDIFNEDHLVFISEEMRQIDIECDKIVDAIMNLFKSLSNYLIEYNPKINRTLIYENEKEMLRILQSKSAKYKTGNKTPLNSGNTWTLSENTNANSLGYQKEKDKNQEYVDVTSEIIQETKQQESVKSKSVKSSFQDMIGGLKSFLLNIFKIVFGGAGELWELIKGILSRIIDFIKTLWDAIRREKKKRLLIELIEEMPPESVVHSNLFDVIMNEM